MFLQLSWATVFLTKEETTDLAGHVRTALADFLANQHRCVGWNACLTSSRSIWTAELLMKNTFEGSSKQNYHPGSAEAKPVKLLVGVFQSALSTFGPTSVTATWHCEVRGKISFKGSLFTSVGHVTRCCIYQSMGRTIVCYNDWGSTFICSNSPKK